MRNTARRQQGGFVDLDLRWLDSLPAATALTYSLAIASGVGLAWGGFLFWQHVLRPAACAA